MPQQPAFPDLRIVPIEHVAPHETHDEQRAQPLIARLKQAEWFTNPPIVAEVGGGRYVVLDGANRHYSLQQLGFPHLLVQVVAYHTPQVELDIWQHVVSQWDETSFLAHLRTIPEVVIEADTASFIARISLRSGKQIHVAAQAPDSVTRNSALRALVQMYQRHARLDRVAHESPESIWHQYPQGIALIEFAHYRPEDILAAAHPDAHLPPGISRHIIYGRALKLNYPMRELFTSNVNVDDKNHRLQQWLQDRIQQRGVRYYAETTFQFDE